MIILLPISYHHDPRLNAQPALTSARCPPLPITI